MTHERLVFGVTIDQLDELALCSGRSRPMETRSRSAVRMPCIPRVCRRWGRRSSMRLLPCGTFSIRSKSNGA